MVDGFFGGTGGPQGEPFRPGDGFDVTDPETGQRHHVTIAGVLAGAAAFTNIGAGEYRYPIITSPTAVAQFSGARTTSFLLAAPGVDGAALASDLQGQFLASGVVAVSIKDRVEQDFAASRSFFRLMQGFLALGLLVGIAGLGVVMVRAVRERRRTIGVLRALGFRSRAIRQAFLAESTLVAVEGIVIGAALAVVTTWLLYRNAATFQGLHAPYPIAWRDIGRDPHRHLRGVDPGDRRPGQASIEDPARGRGQSCRLSGGRCSPSSPGHFTGVALMTSPVGTAMPIVGAPDDYDALLDLVGDRRFVLHRRGLARHARVLPGASAHHPPADRRAAASTAVAVEADWPDAYRVNRYVMGLSDDADADTGPVGLPPLPGVDVAQP